MFGLLRIACKIVPRCEGRSPIFASTIVDEEATDGAAIAVGAAGIAAAEADVDDIAAAGLGRLEVHR